MADTSWKRHERETARYFGTRRRLRGHDFSVSDVEVLVDINEWLGQTDDFKPLLIVECKYSKNMGIVTDYKKLTLKSKLENPMIQLENYIIGELKDFKEFYSNFVNPQKNSSNNINDLRGLKLVQSHKKPPKYLDDYYVQARDYSLDQETEQPILSMVCVTKARLKGRFFVINLGDIETYWKQYREKSTF